MYADLCFRIDIFHKVIKGCPADKIVVLSRYSSDREFRSVIACGYGNCRKQQGHVLHPSHLHFILLQVFVKLTLGHHGVVIAAVPEGDKQFAVHRINGLLLEAFAEAV